MSDQTEANDAPPPARWRRWGGTLAFAALLAALVAAFQLWQTRLVPTQGLSDQAVAFIDARGQVRSDSLAQIVATLQRQYPGRAVGIHLWAEWCPICRAEEHSVSRLVRDAPIVTIAMQSGDARAVQSVLQRRGLPWPTLVDPRGELAQALGFRAVPAFVVATPDGRLRLATVGYTTEIGMRLRLWWAS